MGLELSFFCLGAHRPEWICSSGPELGSLINRKLFLYLIRTVFNYSANFNVIEETYRKQPISLKQPVKQEGEKDLRGTAMDCAFPKEKWDPNIVHVSFLYFSWEKARKDVSSLLLEICPFKLKFHLLSFPLHLYLQCPSLKPIYHLCKILMQLSCLVINFIQVTLPIHITRTIFPFSVDLWLQKLIKFQGPCPMSLRFIVPALDFPSLCVN
jgi:hypothetical protein